ncbi:MAG: triose-phosphate isomerase [Myxococcota bacterium]|jgi:triosephosphate isomerase
MKKGRKPIIAGNWKLNTSRTEAVKLAGSVAAAALNYDDREVMIAPPFVWLTEVASTVKGTGLLVGAQDVCAEKSGAFTGEISVQMLAEAGCTHVIIGHSERRQFYGETDAGVNRKTKAALAGGLIPVVCVGETLSEREAGRVSEVVGRQIREGLAGLSEQDAAKVVVAYEPVWAIGTGKTATSAQAQEVHAFIRGVVLEMFGPGIAGGMRIQYGGSVKPDNVDELMGMPDIDGALVGGASLKADGFARIAGFKNQG